MQHARDDYQRIQDPAGLIPENEPVMLFRAQDCFFERVLEHYRLLLKADGTIQPEMIQAVTSQIYAARAYNHSGGGAINKRPDMPIGGPEHQLPALENADFETTRDTGSPRFIHVCDQCVYLGQRGQYDLYYHGATEWPTVVARYGNDGSDYTSGLEVISIPVLQVAKTLSIEYLQNALTDAQHALKALERSQVERAAPQQKENDDRN